MGNTNVKFPEEGQTVRIVRKKFDSPRKIAIVDVESATPDGSPRYRLTVKDKGLRTKDVQVKNRRGSKEMMKDWLNRYPDSEIVVFEERF
jgi:hypothetical protein